MTALGIIAGAGDLPVAVAESARDSGKAVFILALRGAAGESVAQFDHEWVGIGEVGKSLKALRAHDCSEIVMLGRVARPRFGDIKVDAKGLVLLPRLVAAARAGDDALLRALVGFFDAEGFRTVGVAEAAPGLLASEGTLGGVAVPTDALDDIALATKVVRALGRLDVGQAAVACDGLVLAVEAAEGTDAMIARVASLPTAIRGVPGKRRGVLVKALKPTQDMKTDLPVIGVQTVRGAAAAGLAGIAVEAGRSLVIDRKHVVEAADAEGLFVTAFAPDAFPQ